MWKSQWRFLHQMMVSLPSGVTGRICQITMTTRTNLVVGKLSHKDQIVLKIFKNKLGTNSQQQTFKVPSTAKDKEGSNDAARGGKRMSSTATGGLDLCHGHDKKKVKGEKAKNSSWYSEDAHSDECHGEPDGAWGGSTCTLLQD